MKFWCSLAVIATLAACDSTPATVDGAVGDDDGPSPTPCVALVGRLQARIDATPTSCDVAGDCALVGNASDTFGGPSCNQAIAFGHRCYGDAVNRAAWLADGEATALQRQWYEQCVPLGTDSGVPGWFDCAPGALSCVDHVCQSTATSCWPDAGVQ